MVNVGSLFSGIGGLDCGLARAGFTHVFLCESDEWRRAVLRERFPGVPVYEDVRSVGCSQRVDGAGDHADASEPRAELQPERATSLDLLCGGFPCQDVSVAGQRAGLAGERSGLFFEFARVAGALRPRWILVENVPGLLSSHGGRDFGSVLGTLADLGYGLAWRVLDSRYFGVPQRRRRVFIVGALADGDPRAAAERAGEVLAVGTRCPRHPVARGEAREDAAVASLSGLGSGGPDDNDGQGGRLVSYALRDERERAADGLSLCEQTFPPHSRADGESETFVPYTFDWQAGGSGDTSWRGKSRQWIDDKPGHPARSLVKNKTLAVHEATAVRRLMPIECERLQDLPDGWTLLGPDSRRYAALGDAVTASVAEWIGRRIS